MNVIIEETSEKRNLTWIDRFTGDDIAMQLFKPSHWKDKYRLNEAGVMCISEENFGIIANHIAIVSFKEADARNRDFEYRSLLLDLEEIKITLPKRYESIRDFVDCRIGIAKDFCVYEQGRPSAEAIETERIRRVYLRARTSLYVKRQWNTPFNAVEIVKIAIANKYKYFDIVELFDNHIADGDFDDELVNMYAISDEWTATYKTHEVAIASLFSDSHGGPDCRFFTGDEIVTIANTNAGWMVCWGAYALYYEIGVDTTLNQALVPEDFEFIEVPQNCLRYNLPKGGVANAA